MGAEPPWSINLRGFEYYYTAYIYIFIYIYIKRDEPPLVYQSQGPCIPPNCLYIYKGDEPLWSIDHRGLAYCYTAYIYIYIKEMNPTGLSITEALHTTTLLIYI